MPGLGQADERRHLSGIVSQLLVPSRPHQMQALPWQTGSKVKHLLHDLTVPFLSLPPSSSSPPFPSSLLFCLIFRFIGGAFACRSHPCRLIRLDLRQRLLESLLLSHRNSWVIQMTSQASNPALGRLHPSSQALPLQASYMGSRSLRKGKMFIFSKSKVPSGGRAQTPPSP